MSFLSSCLSVLVAQGKIETRVIDGKAVSAEAGPSELRGWPGTHGS